MGFGGSPTKRNLDATCKSLPVKSLVKKAGRHTLKQLKDSAPSHGELDLFRSARTNIQVSN
jgi:hypothetical protein